MNDVGYATIKSAGALDSSGKVVRIFDVVICDTSNAVNCVRVFSGTSSSATNIPVIFTNSIEGISFGEGIRFPSGAYVIAAGCTATVNYIREL
jgi:hypothetical protein